MSRVKSSTPADIQERPDFGPRFTLADKVRLMLTDHALAGDITWTDAERIQSAVDFYCDRFSFSTSTGHRFTGPRPPEGF